MSPDKEEATRKISRGTTLTVECRTILKGKVHPTLRKFQTFTRFSQKVEAMQNIGIEFPAQGEMAFFDLGSPPAPAPTEIRTRTLYSGVTNGTERHALMNDFGRTNYPTRAGYQHVSVVDGVGNRVEGFSVGDVVFLGVHGGHRGWHLVNVETTNERTRLCIKLPDDVEREFCALFGVAGVGMRHSKRIRVGPAHNVWVAGLGLIGQSVAQASRALGAYVTVTDVNPRRLEIARTLGAHRVLNVSEPSEDEALKHGAPYDRIVDACGAPTLFEDIYRNDLLALYGAIGALAGRGETKFHQSMLHSKRASIESSSHFTLEDLQILLHFVRLGTIRIAPLVTHRFSITEAPHIYETMKNRPEALLGVIFDWKS